MTDSPALHHQLALACDRRDLSPAATADVCSLLLDGTDQAIIDVLAHLRAIPKVRTIDVDTCPETTARFGEVWAETVARQDAHRARIQQVARLFAREVSSYQRSLPDAQAKLDRLCDQRDLASVADGFSGVRLVPHREAVELAQRSFAEAFQQAEQAKAAKWAA